ncbi:hypothetical protein [Lacinutrix sp. Hel_I_90]|uniref:hypothetical protein n=1 Tax=Lacinutrix sp. Hel_I_90 TaxID=1249999 RepID=UPI0005CB4DFF|nr:hypothetical protein [Lacinutrix sp. Hel_I_90]
MSDNKEKQLDEWSKKLFDTASLESPSFNFTAQVMQEVVLLSENKSVKYTPLISKKVWYILGLVFSGLLGFAVFAKVLTTESWFSTRSNIKMTALIPELNISSTALYAIVLFGIMLLVQLPLLKQYFNNRLEV